jgi:HlyD family secretion protein
MKVWAIVAALALVLGGGFLGVRRYLAGRAGAEPYRLARVERGSLTQTVRATGVVQPIRLVQVGTQVNGPVRKLYVDFNDAVKEGDLVAQIDPTVYEARQAQDEANQTQALAAVEQAKARLVQAESELARSQALEKRAMLSKADLETATANRDALAAQVKVAEAAVEQARASLRLSKANLEYTTIRSPVTGVVVSRNVNEGQTVVASMSAQVLFQIATDLSEMQVEASVPEADIGKIRPGQPVTFTVDAHERPFRGTVTQVRLAASTIQNVVTYPVIVRAGNPDGRLFPSMTANIVCEVARRDSTLKVPNAALRFRPVEENGGARTAGAERIERRAEGGDRERRGAGERPGAGGRPGGGRPPSKLWIAGAAGQPPVAVVVTTGISDGAFTEIVEPADLREGQQVIVGLATGNETKAAVVNPFVPQMPRSGRMPPPPR